MVQEKISWYALEMVDGDALNVALAAAAQSGESSSETVNETYKYLMSV